MSSRGIVVIGRGKSLVDCLQEIIRYNSLSPDVFCEILLVVLDTPNHRLPGGEEVFCKKHEIPFLGSDDINSEDFIERLSALSVEYILSVNNHQIMGKRLRSIAQCGALNLHNSPLPKYAGLNACTWAIAKGEVLHGVTLLFVDGGVDTGDIVTQRIFPIPEGCTAIQLIMKCIDEGTILIREYLPKILGKELPRVKQELSKRTQYFMNEVPNSGNVCFDWEFSRFDAFVRSLNLNPFPNTLGHPRATFNGRRFFIDRIKRIDASVVRPGTIVEIDAESVFVSIRNSVISLVEIRDENAKRLKIKDFVKLYNLKIGSLILGGAYGRPSKEDDYFDNFEFETDRGC